jgi:hypothetical protein
MNEITLIREQLAGERARAAAVAQACLEALRRAPGNAASGSVQDFRAACVQYLVQVLSAFEGRDQRLSELAQAAARSDPARQALKRALSLPGQGREALEKLAVAAHAAAQHGYRDWQAFSEYLAGTWSARRAALDSVLAADPRVSHWRTVGGIDADTIMDERGGYARVHALLPAGVMLPPADDPRLQVP